jgi:hypothetical protein
MWCCVDGCVVPDVSVEHGAFIFKSKRVKKGYLSIFLGHLTLEGEVVTVVWKRREPLTQQRSVTFQKSWGSMSNTAEKTSDLYVNAGYVQTFEFVAWMWMEGAVGWLKAMLGHWSAETEENCEWPSRYSLSLGRGLNPVRVEYESGVLFRTAEISVPLWGVRLGEDKRLRAGSPVLRIRAAT